MNKLKLFIENFLVYGFGGIISKMIPLIMVPIITRLMPNSEYYGISDLSNTLINFAKAFAVMGMYDAMYRMFFEKDDENYKKRVCSTAFLFTIGTSVIVFCIMLICKELIADFFFGNEKYAYVVYISAMAVMIGSTNSIIAAPVRMQNKKKIYLMMHTIGPIISYAIAIPLLLAGYYVIALPLAGLISAVSIEVSFGIMNRKWFSLKLYDKEILKELLIIGIPLMPNFLVYWLFNSCDKVMITNILGVGAAGIYSVASKLGHTSQLIYSAFTGGWQYFSFSTMKEENQVKHNSLIFEYLGVISFVATAFICAWSYFIFDILFTKEYLSGYIAAPYLFMAPLLQMLFQVVANQFIIVKKTWWNLIILATGALANVILNSVLISKIGIEGASLATLMGYAVSDVILVIVSTKMKLMVVSRQFIYSTILMIAYIVGWRLLWVNNILIGTVIAILLLVSYGYLYRNDLCNLFRMIVKKK